MGILQPVKSSCHRTKVGIYVKPSFTEVQGISPNFTSLAVPHPSVETEPRRPSVAQEPALTSRRAVLVLEKFVTLLTGREYRDPRQLP